MDELDLQGQHRSVTGVLVSHPDSRDVHIDQLSITFHGAELLVDTSLELNVGRRYGLIGLNGCGEYSSYSLHLFLRCNHAGLQAATFQLLIENES